MKKWLLLLLTSLTSATQAAWQLDNDHSLLSFISTKAYNVGEVHYFHQLEGYVNDQGQVELKIGLDSVDTKVEIRDQRMKELLFETNKYPRAVLTAQLDLKKINDLTPGTTLTEQLETKLDFHGIPRTLVSTLMISRLSEETLFIVSQFPLLLNAADFNLVDGLGKLLELTKLPRISESVPVSFVFTFKKVEDQKVEESTIPPPPVEDKKVEEPATPTVEDKPVERDPTTIAPVPAQQ